MWVQAEQQDPGKGCSAGQEGRGVARVAVLIQLACRTVFPETSSPSVSEEAKRQESFSEEDVGLGSQLLPETKLVTNFTEESNVAFGLL